MRSIDGSLAGGAGGEPLSPRLFPMNERIDPFGVSDREPPRFFLAHDPGFQFIPTPGGKPHTHARINLEAERGRHALDRAVPIEPGHLEHRRDVAVPVPVHEGSCVSGAFNLSITCALHPAKASLT